MRRLTPHTSTTVSPHRLASYNDVTQVARLLLHVAVSPWAAWQTETRLAGAIADLTILTRGRMHERIVEGLRRGMPGTSTDEIDRLARRNLRALWADGDMVWLWRLANSARRRRATCRHVVIGGIEHIHDGLRRGRGVILLESHLGRRVLATATLREAGLSFHQVQPAHHGGAPTWFGQRALRRLHQHLQGRLGATTIEIDPESLGYLRRMTTRLAANGIVCLPGVGFLGSKFVAVDFLGAPRCFPTGPTSLARASGAVLLPFFNLVAADGTERIVIEEPLPVTASGDDGVVECVTRYARLLERYVRRYPEQWPRWHDSPVASVAECRGHVLSAGRRSPSWRAGPDRSPSS